MEIDQSTEVSNQTFLENNLNGAEKNDLKGLDEFTKVTENKENDQNQVVELIFNQGNNESDTKEIISKKRKKFEKSR